MHKLRLVSIAFIMIFCCVGCVDGNSKDNIDNIVGNWETEFNNMKIKKNNDSEFKITIYSEDIKENGYLTVYEQIDGFLLKIEYLGEKYLGFGYELWECHFDGNDKIDVSRKYYDKENPVQNFEMKRQ